MKKLIKKFRGLNLSLYPVEEINRIFNQIGRVYYLETVYNYPKFIHRARPVDNNEVINTVSGLKYKPKNLNKTYQRASIPNQTMFYGSVLPESSENDFIDNTRITGAFESVDFLRNPEIKEGKQKLLFGKWIVKDEITLISIFFMKFRNSRNSWIKKIADEFYKNIEQFEDNEIKRNKTVVNYFAHEFSKLYKDKNDYNYIISSIFANKCLQNNKDGVLYPSPRTLGYGLNVAIKPEIVDSKMDLVSVLECEIFKKNKRVIMNNLRFTKIQKGDDSFNLQEITDERFRFTDEYINKFLNESTNTKKSYQWKNASNI